MRIIKPFDSIATSNQGSAVTILSPPFCERKTTRIWRISVTRKHKCCLGRFPPHLRRIWLTEESASLWEIPTLVKWRNLTSSMKRKFSLGTLVREQQHFSRKILVSVGVSKMGNWNCFNPRRCESDGGALHSMFWKMDSCRTSLCSPTARSRIQCLDRHVVEYIEPE